MITQLLDKDKENRLGSRNGAKEIFEHIWFYGYDIEAVKTMKMPAPFKPFIDLISTEANPM